jgi:uncharacterized protein
MTIERPGDLFDREQEWADLVAFASDPAPGLRIGIVYGRRRQGKSYPLRRLAAATGGFYYQALEHEPAQALAELGDHLGSHLGGPRLALGDWDEAIAALRQLAPRHAGDVPSSPRRRPAEGRSPAAAAPTVVVLDEFPYLLERSPELPSLLQRAVDRSKDERWPAVRLVLCGSSISMMADLPEGQGALRGRVHANLLFQPFDHLDSRRFWAISDPRLAFRVHAVLGGTPGYRELVRSVPSSLDDLDRWIVDDVLSPASALFREDEWLLGEQRAMENRALYLSVLSAVAHGAGTQTAVASQLRRSQQSVLHPLDALVRSGFLEKDDDVLRRRRPTYRIADPIIRFHQVVRHPRTALFEDRRGKEAWVDAQASFGSHVLGPHFERLGREHVRRAGSTLLGEPIVTVGTTVVHDRQARAVHELDLVALGPGSGPRHRTVAAIGEAKLREVHSGDLGRLDRIRTVLPGAERAGIVLASASGFARELADQVAARPDVHLVGLEEIYSG